MSQQRTLVLMRHAKAEAFAGSDEARPLAVTGRLQAAAAGEEINADGPRPDLVLVSSALRTRQTWELLAGRLDAAPASQLREDLYDASARSALDIIRLVEAEVGTLMVVGHEPVMSSLALMLAGPGSVGIEQVRLGVPTATRCILTVPTSWADLGRDGAVLTDVRRTSVT